MKCCAQKAARPEEYSAAERYQVRSMLQRVLVTRLRADFSLFLLLSLLGAGYSSIVSAAQHAIIYYTQGLEVECGDKELESILYSNRALVQLTIGQHESCMKLSAYFPVVTDSIMTCRQATMATRAWTATRPSN